MSKKDLVILGAYPSSEKSKQLLKSCISSLGQDFDIMVCTHYPVDVETQNMIKYYIYDYRNEMIVNEDVYIYGDCDQFYFQGYIEGSANHPGFAIYRSIMNGLRFAKDYYKKFYYIESDSIFSKSDIEKIKNLTNQYEILGKRGWFFELDTVLNSNIFCCDIDFFLETFPHCKTVDDYNSLCNKVGSFGILENFLYCVINSSNKLNSLLTIKNFHFTKYFNESKMCLATYREDGMVYPFELRIVKVENTNKIAYVYVNDNVNSTNETIDFKINDIIAKKLPLSRTYLSEVINSDSDVFIMTVGNYTRKYTRDEIFNSRSFIRFK